MTATMIVAVLVSFTFGRAPVQGMLLLGIDGGRCMRGRSRRSSSERRGRQAPPRRCSTDFHPVSVHSTGYVRVGSVTLLLQKCLRIGPVLPKRLKTGLENGHRNAIIEASSATLRMIPLGMIELDVRRSELLVWPILVPATGPLAVCRGELDSELAVPVVTWSPFNLEIVIGRGAEIGAIDPRGDRRRAKRGRSNAIGHVANR